MLFWAVVFIDRLQIQASFNQEVLSGKRPTDS
jgi:hypothetical protein